MQTQFSLLGAPSGFQFPISPRQLRTLARESRGDFTFVEAKGITMSERYKTKALGPIMRDRHAGIATAERSPEGWRFNLSICALRTCDIKPSYAAVSARILADIEAWVQRTLALPETTPAQRFRLFLGFVP